MKQLTCEMCGGTDLIKQDGVFVCQSCGTKYSVDEAKKMMIEGTVDVSGSVVDVTGSTVNISTKERLQNLYQVARRARDDNNSQSAEKYYEMILVDDPTSWEASFYVVYFRAMSCKIAEIQSAANSVRNCQKSIFSLIQSNEPNKTKAIFEIVGRSVIIANYLSKAAKESYKDVGLNIKSQFTQEMINRVSAARDILYECGNQIESIFSYDQSLAQFAAPAWEAGVEIHSSILSYFSNQSGNIQIIESYNAKIWKFDKDYILQNEIDNIERDIKSLQEKKSKLEAEADKLAESFDKNGLVNICCFIFMLVCGLFIIIISFGEDFFALGIVIGIVGIIGIKGTFDINKNKVQENRQEAEHLQSQIDAKQQEINVKKQALKKH